MRTTFLRLQVILRDPVSPLDAVRDASRQQRALALMVYAALAVLYTHPLLLDVSTHVPGITNIVDTFSDASLQSWYPWRVRTALLESTEGLLHSSWVFFPVGMSMTMQPSMFLHGLLTVPLAWLSFTTANNIVILLSFCLSGFTAFLLAMYVLRSVPAALLAGFVFAFCPYKFQHLTGHYHLMATETLPMVALSLLRLHDRPCIRRALWAAFWLSLTILTSYYYFAFALLVVGGFTVFRAVGEHSMRPVKWGAIVGVMAFVGSSPILLPALLTASTSDYGFARGHDNFKADLLSFIVPSDRQWVSAPVRAITHRLFDMASIDGIEPSSYIGIGVLFLCILSARHGWRGPSSIRIWMLGALLFMVLALGPSLSVNGYETGIWLPYSALMELPFFKGARAPARVAIVGMLCLSVWAGLGLRRMLETRRKFMGLPMSVYALCIVAVILLEYVAPVPLSSVETPDAIRMVLLDDEPGVLSFTPMWPSRTAFFQPLHRRKTLMANLGRADYAVQQYYWRHPALRFLTMPQWADVAPQRAEANYAAGLLGLRYLIVDHSRCSETQLPVVVSALRERYDAQLVYSDSTSTLLLRNHPVWQPDELRVDVGRAHADLHLAYGWSNREVHEGKRVAWLIRRLGQIALPPASAHSYTLALSMQVVARGNVQIAVSVGEQEIGEFLLSPGIASVRVPIPEEVLSQSETNVISLRPSVKTDLPHRTGLTGSRLGLPVPIEVRSGGFWTTGYGVAEMSIGEQTLTWSDRGVFVAIIDPASGNVIGTAHYTPEDGSLRQLEALLQLLPPGTIVALAVRTNGLLRGGLIGSALRRLNASPEMSLGALDGLALIGRISDGDGVAPLVSTGAAEAVVGEGWLPVQADAAIGLLGFDWIEQ